MNKASIWVILGLLASLITLFLAGDVLAGQPLPKQLGFQPAATPVMERIHEFHNLLMYIITAITVFVMILLGIVVVRFNSKANPVPAKFTHNTLIEVIWTVVPVIILIIIAVPSLKLIYYKDRAVEPEMTLKVTAYQWYWGYEYPDHGDIKILSYMIPDDEISGDQVRLLSTDNPVYLPVDTDIQILVTAADVLHSFAVPAFGIKTDAVPGRINETWVRITKPGTYYGQCSELCGKDHAFMPIEIVAVSKQDFNLWAQKTRDEVSSLNKENLVDMANLEEK